MIPFLLVGFFYLERLIFDVCISDDSIFISGVFLIGEAIFDLCISDESIFISGVF
jgi:hypothetical protein